MWSPEDSHDMSPEQEVWAEERSSSSTQPGVNNQPPLCDDCNDDAQRAATSSCLQCKAKYCDDCWAARGPHINGNVGHERIPIQGVASEALSHVSRRLEQVFPNNVTAPTTEGQQRQQHHDVLDTLWLAVTSPTDATGTPLLFNERPRFGDIMEQIRRSAGRSEPPMTYYPRLVSFVGHTGAGKSSLIEVLLRHLWDPMMTDRDLDGIQFPVAGSSDSTLPTSSDIHLYPSPIDGRGKPDQPLLYADCEGFEAAGGSIAGNIMENILSSTFETTMRFARRSLNWLGPEPDRSEVVEKLFPMLVYNISDVVVYVVPQANIRGIGRIIRKLIEWSQKAEMSSVNRISLPSLIILINRCESSKNERWSSDETTSEILESNKNLMKKDKIVKQRKEGLKKYNLPHDSIKDILESSYAAVRFLKLPTAKDMPRFISQVKEFHALIDDLTTRAHNNRRENHFLFSSEKLHHLYQLTFDHFSNSTTAPFDFMEAFFAVHPSPPQLSGNFFELLQGCFEAAKRMSGLLDIKELEELAERVVGGVVPLICSTIATDHHRRKFPGTLGDFFKGEKSELIASGGEVRVDSFEETVQGAFRMFADLSLPCGYSPGNETGVCVNGKKAHGDRHQDAEGRILGFGSFDTAFEERFTQRWAYALASEIAKLQKMGSSCLWYHHRTTIRNLHKSITGLSLSRLPSCVWCMRNFPTERLSCGHWICSACIVNIGEREETDRRVFIIKRCDQHPEGDQILNPAFEFLDLPTNVGRRLLSLDEGGVRGILQLKLLAAVQARLGGKIPMEQCFDLIGGTGIGGIHALGFGIGQWSIFEAIKKFKGWAPTAFQKQSPGFWDWLFGHKKPPYVLDGLVQCIGGAFGDDRDRPMTMSLSNGAVRGRVPIRTFVTSIREGLGAILLANYRRSITSHAESHRLEQSHKSQQNPQLTDGCSVGQAATVAGCFKPFFGSYYLSPGNHMHVGGAKEFACPAAVTLQEAQSLWPNMSNDRSDLLISVGCGHEVSETSDFSASCTSAEAMWKRDFEDRSLKEPGVYIRLCPEFSKNTLPDADDVSFLTRNPLPISALVSPQDYHEKIIDQDNIHIKVDQIAQRLISTIFYFEKSTTQFLGENGWIVYGCIRCRYKETSNLTKAFGSHIASLKNPHFVAGGQLLWTFDATSLRGMAEQGRFRAPFENNSFLEISVKSEDDMRIKFRADGVAAQSISGISFPGELPPVNL